MWFSFCSLRFLGLFLLPLAPVAVDSLMESGTPTLLSLPSKLFSYCSVTAFQYISFITFMKAFSTLVESRALVSINAKPTLVNCHYSYHFLQHMHFLLRQILLILISNHIYYRLTILLCCGLHVPSTLNTTCLCCQMCFSLLCHKSTTHLLHSCSKHW